MSSPLRSSEGCRAAAAYVHNSCSSLYMLAGNLCTTAQQMNFVLLMAPPYLRGQSNVSTSAFSVFTSAVHVCTIFYMYCCERWDMEPSTTVNIKDDDGMASLHVAARVGDHSMAALLLQNGRINGLNSNIMMIVSSARRSYSVIIRTRS